MIQSLLSRFNENLISFLEILHFIWGQFHQHFMCTFFVWKQILQLFSNYRSALWLFGERILAKNVHIKCWWNWPLKALVHGKKCTLNLICELLCNQIINTTYEKLYKSEFSERCKFYARAEFLNLFSLVVGTLCQLYQFFCHPKKFK